MKKIVRLTESDLVRLVNKVMNEQSLDKVKSYVQKGINKLTGKTGNKFWDAILDAKDGKMIEGNKPSERVFCLDDSCENNLTVFSDGRVIFRQLEFDKEFKGRVILNSDGSYVYKWDDGGVSKKYLPRTHTSWNGSK